MISTHTFIKKSVNSKNFNLSFEFFVSPDLCKKYGISQVEFNTSEVRLLSFLLQTYSSAAGNISGFNSKSKILDHKIGFNQKDKKVIYTFVSEQNYVFDVINEMLMWVCAKKLSNDQQKIVGEGNYDTMCKDIKNMVIITVGNILSFVKNFDKKSKMYNDKLDKIKCMDRQEFKHEITVYSSPEIPLEQPLNVINKVDFCLVSYFLHLPISLSISNKSITISSLHNISYAASSHIPLLPQVIGQYCKKNRLISKALPKEAPTQDVKKKKFKDFVQSYKVGYKMILNSCGLTDVEIPSNFNHTEIKSLTVPSTIISKLFKEIGKNHQ